MAEDIKSQIQQAINSQPQKTVTMLSCLLAVQDECGYISTEAVEAIALKNNTSINDVWAVASFYTNFRFTPPAKNIIEICWGPTCHLKGAQEILKVVQGRFSLESEGDTEDGLVSLKYNTCIGACSQAPVITINHKPVHSVTPEQILEKINKALKKRT
jgi:NADH:ubiquinone oxidoreductase subunit E